MTEDQGLRTEDDRGFVVRYRLWILLLLTSVAGVVRFATLTRPPLWGDEAFTYYRVSGDFQDLLDILQFNGFPPLHYEAYWALGQAHKLTPRTMRVIPATAGTLMVPAMYFLAVQLVRKRVALLVALFTCCSAYMMVYAHDAKMYMACWLFVTLHVGSLLWWLRRGRAPIGRVAWLAWVACGIAAAGMHHSANLVLPIELIVLLTFPRSPLGPSIARRVPLFLLGLVVILAGPAGYFVGFNRVVEKNDEQGFSVETVWVESYNVGRKPTDLALYTATAHLYSWEWPQNADKRQIDPDLLHGLMSAGVALLLLIAAGVMPWRRTLVDADPPAQTWWRLYLWLGAWIVVIGFGMYCASVKHFSSPKEVAVAAGELFAGHWWVMTFEVVSLAILSHFWPSLPRHLGTAVPVVAALALVAGAFTLVDAVVKVMSIDETWAGSQLQAHYWPVLTDWWRWVSAPRVLVILAAALPVVAWHFSGDRLPERATRLGQFAAVTAVIALACWGAWWVVDHRFHATTAKMVAERHVDQATAEEATWANWMSVWMPRYLGVIWPAIAIATCALLARLPAPLRYTAVTLLIGVNLAQAAGRLYASTEPPSDRITEDVIDSQDRPSGAETRAYFLNMGGLNLGAPGSQSIFSHQTRYYLSQASTRPIKPVEFKFTGPSVAATLKVWGLRLWTDYRADAIAAEAKSTSQLRRLVVWEKLNRPGEPGILADLRKKLGEGWHLSSDRTFPGRDHWTWTDLWLLRRHEFVRVAPAATAPSQ